MRSTLFLRDDIEFLYTESLPYHPNALTFLVELKNEETLAETFYSVGGGFVKKEGEEKVYDSGIVLPFPINTNNDLLHWCRSTGLSINEIVLENENAIRPENETQSRGDGDLAGDERMYVSGCHTEGLLPGGLQVKRRAFNLNKKLLKNCVYSDYESWIQCIRNGGNQFNYILDWVSCLALAVNEENALFWPRSNRTY